MGQLVEFPLQDGGSVLVEVTQPTGPVTRGRGGSDVTERARCTFEQAVERVEPATQAIITRLRAMPATPEEVHVEFGLDLHAEAGAFIRLGEYHGQLQGIGDVTPPRGCLITSVFETSAKSLIIVSR